MNQYKYFSGSPMGCSQQVQFLVVFFVLSRGFVAWFDFDAETFSLFLETGFFDLCGAFFATVPSFFKIYDFVPDFSLDSDCDVTVFSFFSSSGTFDSLPADLFLIDLL